MYKVQNNRKYYIYNCRKEQYIAVCDSFDEMLYQVARYNHFDWFTDKVGNHILEDYNCTMKDTHNYFQLPDSNVLREYVIFDDTFRIIDIRDYADKIFAFDMKNRKCKWKSKKHIYEMEKNLPRFRKDPIPRTSHKWRFGSFYRYPRTTQEIRNNSIPEYEQFVRKKRKQIPTAYDDIPRGQSRSWKDQSKKRKQWM